MPKGISSFGAQIPRAARPDLYDRARGSAASRGYDRAWQKVRAIHLQAEPLCRFCDQQGRVVAAAVVDHIVEIVKRPELRLDRDNLRSLCKECHDRRTAQAQAAARRPTP